jgi:hypothetical protein
VSFEDREKFLIDKWSDIADQVAQGTINGEEIDESKLDDVREWLAGLTSSGMSPELKRAHESALRVGLTGKPYLAYMAAVKEKMKRKIKNH